METERVLASDAEREAYATRIRDAVTEGRLTLAEGDERLATLYATRFRDELDATVADLPRPEQPGPSRSGRGSRPGERGPRWAEHGPRWERHGRHGRFPFGPLVFIAVLVGLWALSGAHFFWPIIPIVFIMLGCLRHRHWHHEYHRERSAERA